MQKINKSEVLASVYKKEIDEFNTKNEVQPKYRSKHKYYNSVLLSLLFCQNGLCAYTERRLMEVTDLEKYKAQIQEEKGKLSQKINFEITAQIEHFDGSLKSEKGWEWSNLFAVYAPINTKVKHTKPVDFILKPDSEDYDPFKMLEYDIDDHIFTPNPRLSFEIFQRVQKMIITLGLNWGEIRKRRKRYLVEILENYKNGEEINPYEFITAFEMSKSELEKS